MILPLLVFTVAIASAFTTSDRKQGNAKVAMVQGWIQHAGQPCTASIQCRTEVNPFCTAPVSGVRLYAKDLTGDCPTPLYKQ